MEIGEYFAAEEANFLTRLFFQLNSINPEPVHKLLTASAAYRPYRISKDNRFYKDQVAGNRVRFCMRLQEMVKTAATIHTQNIRIAERVP